MQCLFALSEAQRSRRCGEKHMSETVTGYIDHVIFRNEDNGYTVMVLKGTKKEEELTAGQTVACRTLKEELLCIREAQDEMQ